MSDLEDYQALSRVELEIRCGILEAEARGATQIAQDIKKLVLRRIQDLTASVATTGPDARGPVAGGSGQVVTVPQEPTAPPDPSVGRSAPGSNDTPNTLVYRGRDAEPRRPMSDRRGPGKERSTRTQANRDRATCTPISLGGTNRQNAAQAGAGYAGTSAPASAQAQAQVSNPPHVDADNCIHNCEAILREAGVCPSRAMTPEDLDLSSRTPDITARSFRTLIGGDSYLERPQSKECTLCINRDAQPYAPHSPGESGLVLIYPDIVLREVGEDTSQTFNLFLNKNPTLSRKEGERQIQYLGTYTKVPIVHAKLEPNEWRSLPAKCRTTWIRRIHSSVIPDVREMQARISLRRQRKGGPPPSTDAICKWFEQNPNKRQDIGSADIRAALSSGEEKIEFEVIKYVRYDHDIATRLWTTLLEDNLA